jgi:uncharacterized protein
VKVFLRFYEELNHFLPMAQQKDPIALELKQRSTIKDVIESLGVPHTEVDLILINGESVEFGHLLNDCDQVSVYPMFESFDITSITKLRKHPLRRNDGHQLKFVVDVNLGKLAIFLRMLGFDVIYHPELHEDAALAAISQQEHRVLLTRDLGLLKRKNVTYGYFLRSQHPTQQILEVLRRFDLLSSSRLCTRCLECNTPVISIPKGHVLDRIPPRVAEAYDDFFICPDCKKIYWQGTHFQGMRMRLEKWQKTISP